MDKTDVSNVDDFDLAQLVNDLRKDNPTYDGFLLKILNDIEKNKNSDTSCWGIVIILKKIKKFFENFRVLMIFRFLKKPNFEISSCKKKSFGGKISSQKKYEGKNPLIFGFFWSLFACFMPGGYMLFICHINAI